MSDWCFDKIEPTRFGDQKYQALEQKFQNNVEVVTKGAIQLGTQ